MIFEPYSGELDFINHIHEYNHSDYAIIRLTNTMINKNNIDANFLLRNLLKKYHIVDYDALSKGASNGVRTSALFLNNDTSDSLTMNFYRVTGSGGRLDPRFSIYTIKELSRTNRMNVDDLLYFTITKSNQLAIINLTKNKPTSSILKTYFGEDHIQASLNHLITKMRTITSSGFIPSKGSATKNSDRLAGDTLEHLLGIPTNNFKYADFEGLIELKTKTSATSHTLDTLFTLRPQFEGTPVANYENKDSKRVSALTRLYGYESEAHEGFKSLYVTIGSSDAPQNRHGLFLHVNESESRVELKKSLKNASSEVIGFWDFNNLEAQLQVKHGVTLWVKTSSKKINDVVHFQYTSAELTRSPQFATFLTLIKTGVITYDWRGYTTPTGPYKGKNHGNAWRIKNKERNSLFGTNSPIDLT